MAQLSSQFEGIESSVEKLGTAYTAFAYERGVCPTCAAQGRPDAEHGLIEHMTLTEFRTPERAELARTALVNRVRRGRSTGSFIPDR